MTASTINPTGATLVAQVDALARHLRDGGGGRTPRHALAEALDWYVGEWAASGYAAPCRAVVDHLRTLSEAAAEREQASAGSKSAPVDDPWPVER